MIQIKKIAIIGVGFMGGSFALRMREVYPDIVIWGYARNKQSYRKLAKLQVVDRVDSNLKNVVTDADLIVLSAPVYVIIRHLQQIVPYLKKGAIVLDVGSTKEVVENAAKQILPGQVKFVGCHPLCGSEKQGAQFSCADIYKGAVCIITSSLRCNATQMVKKLWQSLGMNVIHLSSRRHDQILSAVSHLPHIISFALMQYIPFDYRKFPLASLRDLIRISNSPSHVWAEIFLSNKVNLIHDIKAYITVLRRFEDLLRKGDEQKILLLIKSINDKHQHFLSSRCSNG